ncbi:hypothetical protein UlMin_006498 [Ulmus minor]
MVISFGNPDSVLVQFNSTNIETLVTHIPSKVDAWIDYVELLYRHSLDNLIVGFDIEWRPAFNSNIHNPVAIVQLCVGRNCLIFQLIHAQFIPRSLIDFLGNSYYRFVGVGIRNDVEKLLYDYGLFVRNWVEVRDLATIAYGDPNMRNTSLKNLAGTVLGMEIEKPRAITLGRWDKLDLDSEQVKYACVDAFVSYELGKRLV